MVTRWLSLSKDGLWVDDSYLTSSSNSFETADVCDSFLNDSIDGVDELRSDISSRSIDCYWLLLEDSGDERDRRDWALRGSTSCLTGSITSLCFNYFFGIFLDCAYIGFFFLF